MPGLITAAICTYDRYPLLARAVESLRTQNLPREDYSILVIDNSPDQTRAAAERDHAAADVRYVLEPRPGLSNARNVAMSLCETRWLAFLDDDAIAQPDWLARLIEGFERFPQAGATGGPVEPIWSAPRPAWLHDAMLGALTVVDWGGELRAAAPDEWLAGANIAFELAALREVGGFPAYLGRVGTEGALLGNEESEVVRRLRDCGRPIVYAPAARVSHHVPSHRLQQGWFRKRAAWQAISDFLAQPETGAAHAGECWDVILRRIAGLEPGPADFGELYDRCVDAEAFRTQVDAIYQMVTVMLSGDRIGASAPQNARGPTMT